MQPVKSLQATVELPYEVGFRNWHAWASTNTQRNCDSQSLSVSLESSATFTSAFDSALCFDVMCNALRETEYVYIAQTMHPNPHAARKFETLPNHIRTSHFVKRTEPKNRVRLAAEKQYCFSLFFLHRNAVVCLPYGDHHHASVHTETKPTHAVSLSRTDFAKPSLQNTAAASNASTCRRV